MSILTDDELNAIAKGYWPKTAPTIGLRRMMRDAVDQALIKVAGWKAATVGVPINTNSEFAATLTKEGAIVYNAYHWKFPADVRPPEVEENSTVRMELWHLMHIFGGHMNNGSPLMFVKNEITPTVLR